MTIEIEHLNKSIKKDVRIIVSLTVALVICKLAGFINISWGWALSPVWIFLSLIASAFLIGYIVMSFNDRKYRKK